MGGAFRKKLVGQKKFFFVPITCIHNCCHMEMLTLHMDIADTSQLLPGKVNVMHDKFLCGTSRLNKRTPFQTEKEKNKTSLKIDILLK